MFNPVRWLRNRRADKDTWDAMTPAQRSVVDAFGIPPRMFAGAGIHANAQTDTEAWADHVLGERPRNPWPTAPGVQPISVSHDKRCDPWSLLGGCHRDCTAPDRRISPLRHDDGRSL